MGSCLARSRKSFITLYTKLHFDNFNEAGGNWMRPRALGMFTEQQPALFGPDVRRQVLAANRYNSRVVCCGCTMGVYKVFSGVTLVALALLCGRRTVVIRVRLGGHYCDRARRKPQTPGAPKDPTKPRAKDPTTESRAKDSRPARASCQP